MRGLIFLLALLFLAACADTHNVRNIRSAPTKLNNTSSIFVALPKDGRYGTIVYNGSGQMTATALQSEFLTHANRVEIANSFEELDGALDRANNKNIEYLCYPIILHWEDRATEWSGIPDKVSVKVSIYDVSTRNEIASTIIEGASGVFTFGGDRPQDLLPKPTKTFVSTLF